MVLVSGKALLRLLVSAEVALEVWALKEAFVMVLVFLEVVEEEWVLLELVHLLHLLPAVPQGG